MSLLINDDVILGGVANLEVTDVGNHVGKERVAGYVERHTQTLRRGRIKELSDYLVANKHFEKKFILLLHLLFSSIFSDTSIFRLYI